MAKHKMIFRNSKRLQACKEGDISDYLLNAVADLDKANEEAIEKEEKERKKRVEDILAFERQMEQESKEPFDYNRSAYASFKKPEQNKAFKVRFLNHPEYLYVAFTTTRNKAHAEAQRYIRNTYFPTFSIDDCPVSLKETRSNRVPELDKYGEGKKAPISELMKIGIRFTCSGCGKINFDYTDYATRKCFIVESDGDIVPFAKGMVFCYSCYHSSYH